MDAGELSSSSGLSATGFSSAGLKGGRCVTLEPRSRAVLPRLCCLSLPPTGNRDLPQALVPTGSPSRGWDVAVYVFDIHQPSLPLLFFYSVLVSVSVFMALSTVFHSIDSPNNSPLSHSVLPVLFLPCWSIQLSFIVIFISLDESLLQPSHNLLWLTGLTYQLTLVPLAGNLNLLQALCL